MRKILLAAFIGAALLLSASARAQCPRTGFKLNASSSADTVYFTDTGGAPFYAKTLYLKLGKTALGYVVVRRIGPDSTMIDDSLAVSIQAGKCFVSNDDAIIGFAFYKAGLSTDKLVWSASRCPESYASEDETSAPSSMPMIEGGDSYSVSDDTTHAGTDTLKYGYRLANGTAGHWYATRITIGPDATYSATVKWFYEGVKIRTQPLWPGGSIYDQMLCDSVWINTAQKSDTVVVGGQK